VGIAPIPSYASVAGNRETEIRPAHDLRSASRAWPGGQEQR